MSENIRKDTADISKMAARKFLEEEQAFRLGFLPTEQPNPRTQCLTELAGSDPQAACALLFSVDAALAAPLQTAMDAPSFGALVHLIKHTIHCGGRIFLSGCGATGRLCLLLESSWREACRRGTIPEKFSDSVRGFMTGGDYAFIRSVESFEDYETFGAQQVADNEVGPADCIIGISEGGETASVLGSVQAARKNGARAAFVCNNPHALLRERIERSRRVLADPEVLCVELNTGPMALTGSTRMQATTSELLYLGAALEQTAIGLSDHNDLHNSDVAPQNGSDYVSLFIRLVESLASPQNTQSLGQWIKTEAETYTSGGCVTYYAMGAMLDILTDITERTPTFALPPLSPHYRQEAARPWALVKHPFLNTPQTWNFLLGRAPSCLCWKSSDYARLQASAQLIASPPCIDEKELLDFHIGNEPAPARQIHTADRALLIRTASDKALDDATLIGKGSYTGCANYSSMTLCDSLSPLACRKEEWTIRCPLPASPLRLWEHLALKMTLNTVSTAVMARVGRTDSNWMTHVQPTNKKLIDRSCRIIQALQGIPYESACQLLFEELQANNLPLAERPSPVQAILHHQKEADNVKPSGEQA